MFTEHRETEVVDNISFQGSHKTVIGNCNRQSISALKIFLPSYAANFGIIFRVSFNGLVKTLQLNITVLLKTALIFFFFNFLK